MRSIIYCIVFLSLSTLLYGQKIHSQIRSVDALNSLIQKELTGGVVISLDTLIFENYNKHIIQNSKNQGIEGYRIRIFSDNGHGAKESQKRVRARFLSLYSDISTYHRYEGSYYKIYIGDFRTKRDALKILDTIKRNFPDAFIVEDSIVIEE